MGQRTPFVLLLLFCCTFPLVSFAKFTDFLPDDLVPCGNDVITVVKDGDEGPQICTTGGCTTCDLVVLAQNIINFLIFAAIVVAVYLIVNAGILLITSGGNQSSIGKAKSMIRSGVIGLIVCISAWLLIDTVMKVLYDSEEFGPWNELVCPTSMSGEVCASVRATLEVDAPAVPHSVGPGYTQGDVVATPDGPQLSKQAIGNASVSLSKNCVLANGVPCADAITKEAVAQGVDPNFALALAKIESGGCKNPATCTSKVGAVGVIQLMPATARGLCGAPCKGYSDAQMKTYLSDPSNNIKLGVAYMKEAQNNKRVNELAGGDSNRRSEYMAAFYNGGPKALTASKTCPGKTYYECTANAGYRETRGYVNNMKKIMGS